MLAESVHSVADTSNQGLLLLGQRQSRKEADPLHQFGYGRSRYFYSFVVAMVLFTLGSVFALYEGYHKISHPEELTSPIVAIAILVVAICLEGYSFRTAVKESRPLKGSGSWWRFIRTSRNPELAGGAAGGLGRARRPGLRADRRRADDADRRTRCGTASAPSASACCSASSPSS